MKTSDQIKIPLRQANTDNPDPFNLPKENTDQSNFRLLILEIFGAGNSKVTTNAGQKATIAALIMVFLIFVVAGFYSLYRIYYGL